MNIPLRKRLFGRWALAGLAVTCALAIVANVFDLTHVYLAPFRDVKEARFILGRWPSNWDEVSKATTKYNGFAPLPTNFSWYKSDPIDHDTCLVSFGFHNLFGFPYSESKRLVMSATEVKALSDEEVHTATARVIGSFLEMQCSAKSDALGCVWDALPGQVRENNGGGFPKIEKAIALRSSASSPIVVRFEFRDGEVRRQELSLGTQAR